MTNEPTRKTRTGLTEIDEIIDFQKAWHEFVGMDYWGNGFAVFDCNGKVDVYKTESFVDPSSGKKLVRRKNKLLGCSKSQDGELLGHILIKTGWYKEAKRVIERNKLCPCAT